MCLLYEDYSFSPARVKDSEALLTIGLTTDAVDYTCPVCGESFTDKAAFEDHMKGYHSWQWHLWYAPHGKPLLALTLGGSILAIGLAFAPTGK